MIRNGISLILKTVLIGFSFIASIQQNLGQIQAPEIVVKNVMAVALSRCYSNIDGVKRISFEPATKDEFSQISVLGEKGILPLAKYLDLRDKDGFTQLFAVKFIIAIGGQSALEPLKRALQQDQWEVTRAQALAGLFQISPSEAQPYIQASLNDGSSLVRQRANDLWKLYTSN
jgi:hypothetical protein